MYIHPLLHSSFSLVWDFLSSYCRNVQQHRMKKWPFIEVAISKVHLNIRKCT